MQEHELIHDQTQACSKMLSKVEFRGGEGSLGFHYM